MFDDPLTREQKKRLQRYADVAPRVMNLNARLLLETLGEPEHLTNEEVSAFVDNAEWLDRDRVEDHLEFCGDCSAKVTAIQKLYDELAVEMEAGMSPLPNPEPSVGATLVDTSGLLTLAGDGVQLPSMAKLGKSLQTLIHDLFTLGIAKPTKSLRELLAIQRDSIVYLSSPALSRGTRARDTHLSRRSASGSASPHNTVLISPKDTVIRSATPVLQWQAVPGAREYKVNLLWQKDRIDVRTLWESSVGERTETALSDTIRLEPDQLYFWTVEAVLEDAADRIESHPAWFAVLSPKAQKQLETLERVHADSALMLAGLYEQHGLYEDAQGQIERLKALNPGNPLIETLQQQLDRERNLEPMSGV